MDLHRLAEERSVAYHSVIAERLRQQERWKIWRETRDRFSQIAHPQPGERNPHRR
jgi:hypothetical protein